MASCCCCQKGAAGGVPGIGGNQVPIICLVPRDEAAAKKFTPPKASNPGSGHTGSHNDIQLLDEDYLKKHFNLPQRALYLDPFRRPLITFPMTGEKTSKNFNIDRKAKINQMILDGKLDPCESITAPSVFPYPTLQEKKKAEEEEIIYILQLPDLETKCPVHNQTVRTPRFIWHSCKKKAAGADDGSMEFKPGPGPMHKPKPWLLSRHTDFDLMSQW